MPAPVQWSDAIDEVIGGDLTAALAYVTPAGGSVVTAVAPIGLRDRDAGTVGFTTSLGLGRKLERRPPSGVPRGACAAGVHPLHGSAQAGAVLGPLAARLLRGPRTRHGGGGARGSRGMSAPNVPQGHAQCLSWTKDGLPGAWCLVPRGPGTRH